jgi:hypothetical protein
MNERMLKERETLQRELRELEQEINNLRVFESFPGNCKSWFGISYGMGENTEIRLNFEDPDLSGVSLRGKIKDEVPDFRAYSMSFDTAQEKIKVRKILKVISEITKEEFWKEAIMTYNQDFKKEVEELQNKASTKVEMIEMINDQERKEKQTETKTKMEDMTKPGQLWYDVGCREIFEVLGSEGKCLVFKIWAKNKENLWAETGNTVKKQKRGLGKIKATSRWNKEGVIPCGTSNFNDLEGLKVGTWEFEKNAPSYYYGE